MASTYKERDTSNNSESLAEAIGEKAGGTAADNRSGGLQAGKQYSATDYAQRAQELQGSVPAFQANDSVVNAKNYLDNVVANKPGAYQGKYTGMVDRLYQQIMGRPSFSYNQNNDAMYQMYAQKYRSAGQQGMRNAMGAAAAQQTGGYGSSYAQTAGQQAYNASMGQLAETVPQLQQQALSRYNDETQRLNDMYGTASQAEQTEYGRHQDRVNRWQSERDYAANEYDRQYNNQYNEWRDTNNYAMNMVNMEREDTQQAMSTAQNQVMAAINQGITPPRYLVEQAGWDYTAVKKMAKK